MSNYFENDMDFEEELGEKNLMGSAEVEKVIEWLPKAPGSFDAKFVWSLHQQLCNGRNLSQKQLASIKNIIEKFRIGLPAQTRNPSAKSAVLYHKNTDATAHYY